LPRFCASISPDSRSSVKFRIGHPPIEDFPKATTVQPNVPSGTRLEITLPTGDAEMLDQIRNRCHTINTRVAGVSCRLHTTFPRT
jgi:hypothetical protein